MDQKGKAAIFWQEEWLGDNINNLEKNDEDLNQKYGSEMRKNKRIFNGENKVDSHISGLSDWAVSITQVGNAIQKKIWFLFNYLNTRHDQFRMCVEHSSSDVQKVFENLSSVKM